MYLQFVSHPYGDLGYSAVSHIWGGGGDSTDLETHISVSVTGASDGRERLL